ncbi:hypothetical protein [Sphingobium estronivorans]|uniref:hypothetical protein n=1 Tax=Sphingobium estronivorans TaxID=1577690 RepID=UPI00123A2DA5|nr:hypothetical protein [Sphingobium estronivorans]
MLSFSDTFALRRALVQPLPGTIQGLLRLRINRILADGLGDYTHLVVLTAEDTEAMLVADIGFSPLEHDGLRYGAPGFIRRWDILHNHGGWFEMVFCIGNGGWAVVLLIEEAQDSSFPEIRAACRAES